MENVSLEKVRKCTDEVELFRLLKSDAPGVAIEIARSPHATERILDQLTHYPSITVRHEVAKNLNTSDKTLNKLSEDKEMLVRDYARISLEKKKLL